MNTIQHICIAFTKHVTEIYKNAKLLHRFSNSDKLSTSQVFLSLLSINDFILYDSLQICCKTNTIIHWFYYWLSVIEDIELNWYEWDTLVKIQISMHIFMYVLWLRRNITFIICLENCSVLFTIINSRIVILVSHGQCFMMLLGSLCTVVTCVSPGQF